MLSSFISNLVRVVSVKMAVAGAVTRGVHQTDVEMLKNQENALL